MPEEREERWVCQKCEDTTCYIALFPTAINRKKSCVLSKKYILINITDGSVVGEYEKVPSTQDREQTKIMAIPCRDCRATLTLLAGMSANIIEARCPVCTEAFRKAGEEYNKSIGYTPPKEPLSDLVMSTLADNSSFGLAWLLKGEESDRVVRLLEDGIKFCDNIEETEQSKAIKVSLQGTAEALKKHLDETIANKINLRFKSPYNEQETHMMQRFFNETSAPYLKKEWARTRKRRRW